MKECFLFHSDNLTAQSRKVEISKEAFAVFCCAWKVPSHVLELSGGEEDQEWDLKNGGSLKCRAPGAPGHRGFP